MNHNKLHIMIYCKHFVQDMTRLTMTSAQTMVRMWYEDSSTWGTLAKVEVDWMRVDLGDGCAKEPPFLSLSHFKACSVLKMSGTNWWDEGRTDWRKRKKVWALAGALSVCQFDCPWSQRRSW